METVKTLEHIPVMLSEVLELADAQPGMRIVDATLGAGGYTRALLDATASTGEVLALDWDREAIQRAMCDVTLGTALAARRLSLMQESFGSLVVALHRQGWTAADIIVADLGLSSLQLDNPQRGLSFQTDGPLDMRLNSNETVTAADIVNTWPETSLSELFRVYADEGEAERIAKALVRHRAARPILRTVELAEVVQHHVALARRRARIHPATKVFQALRMAVNSERPALQALLTHGWDCLAPRGKLLIVTFHSGEDSLVKQSFRQRVETGIGTLLVKKPIQPTVAECRHNPRARSAKLRGIQKH